MALQAYDKMIDAFREWLSRNSPECREIVETISQSMERNLTLIERVKLKAHLWVCAWCARYQHQLYLIRVAAQTIPSDPTSIPQPNLSPDARQRIKARLLSEES